MSRDDDRGDPPNNVDPAVAEDAAEAPAPPTAAEIAREALRYRRLQRAVDVSLALINQSRDLSLGESLEIVVAARSIALDLFPGSGETFDRLYRPRLMRAIAERFGIEEAPA